MAKNNKWAWKAHSLHNLPRRDAETVMLRAVDADQNGDTLWALDGSFGPPCMTAAEWRCFCIELMSESPIRDGGGE
jgi:hypothetical protein